MSELCQCSPGCQISYGYCHCGRGGNTSTATNNSRRSKGTRFLFIHGHGRRKIEHSNRVLREWYEDGQSITAIAKRLGVGATSVRSRLLLAGTTMRNPQYAARIAIKRHYESNLSIWREKAGQLLSPKWEEWVSSGGSFARYPSIRKAGNRARDKSAELKAIYVKCANPECPDRDTLLRRTRSQVARTTETFCSRKCRAVVQMPRKSPITETNGQPIEIPDWIVEAQKNIAALQEAK